MSLHDRYHRDEGRIQRMDTRCTEFGDRVGTFWHEQTGFSRESLTKGLYLLSIAAGVQHFTLYREFGALLIVVIAALSFKGIGGQSRGGIVEQIQSEASGLPKNSIAFFRLLILMLGTYALVNGMTQLVALELSADVVITGLGGQLLVGLALIGYQLSEYIRRTNPTPGSGRGRGKLVHSGSRS